MLLPFLPPDNGDGEEDAVAENVREVTALCATLVSAPGITPCAPATAEFLRTYLRNRHRFYDAPPPPGSNLEALDRCVLELLSRLYRAAASPAGARAPAGGGGRLSALPSTAGPLDAPALFDLAALHGPSNGATVSAILADAFAGDRNLRYEIASALATSAAVLTEDVPAALEAAAGVPALDDLLAYVTDVVHSTSRLLELSPVAAYASAPVGGVHDGPSLTAPGGIVRAMVDTYEHTLPDLSNRLVAAARSAGGSLSDEQGLRLRVSSRACLSSVADTLDTCYTRVLAGGGAGGEAAELRTGSRGSAAAVGPALASVLLTFCEGWSSGGGISFARDLVGACGLRDTIGAALRTSEAASGLPEATRREVLQTLDAIATGASSGGASRQAIAAVREVLPDASVRDVERALGLSGGDVGGAIERLVLTGDGEEGGAGAVEEEEEAEAFPALRAGSWLGQGRGQRDTAVPNDIRAATLALVRGQEEGAALAAQIRALGLPPGPGGAPRTTLPPVAAPAASALASAARSAARDAKKAARLEMAREATDGGARLVAASELAGEGGDEDGEEVLSGRGRGPVVLLRPDREYDDELDDAFGAADFMEVRGGGGAFGEEEGEGVQGGRAAGSSSAPVVTTILARGAGGPPGRATAPPVPAQPSAEEEEEKEEGYDDELAADASLAGLVNSRAAPAGAPPSWSQFGPDARRGRGRGRGSGGGRGGAAAGAAPAAPVAGHGPRAQGGLTERAADMKGVHKARTGNHNRKRGADKKMARAGGGMPVGP